MANEILIIVRGGVVQDVYGDYGADVEIIDYDDLAAEGDQEELTEAKKKEVYAEQNFVKLY